MTVFEMPEIAKVRGSVLAADQTGFAVSPAAMRRDGRIFSDNIPMNRAHQSDLIIVIFRYLVFYREDYHEKNRECRRTGIAGTFPVGDEVSYPCYWESSDLKGWRRDTPTISDGDLPGYSFLDMLLNI